MYCVSFSITKLKSDLDVTGAKTTLNIPHIWSIDSAKNYTIKAKGDKQACVIYGCCMLPTGEILLADWNNRRLKKLNDRYQVISVRDLPGFPCDVCYWGNNTAVLAMVNKMQFVDVRGGMSLTRRVKISQDCRGLACHGDQLYVVGGSSVYKYSTSSLPSLLYTDHSGRVSFRHIAVSNYGNYIYITDTTSQIHIIDNEGNHLYTCTDPELHGAWGVCVDGEDHVLTCNRVSKKVLQISSGSFQKLGIIADRTNVSNAEVLCFNRSNATLVTAGVSDEIVVLKLK
ncbi:uncharacterized protein LOC123541541 [Mercenaria mercenaria]|uniref:uncharacterized protein LOC123541541 n=1 Tax=Mercenaria mercenaria TaxID=6596 RepID=UPI00234F802F|nr:uncharacterized protein LOC123541541 [Mercenaria mercenaria]